MTFTHVLFFLCCFLSLRFANSERLDIFLINITIFQSHETSLPFTTNHPEVYLSCDDGRPKVNLDNVRRTKQLYQYSTGDINATFVNPDGCVDCKLRESDGSALLADDTFGSWTMCQSDFEETGYHNVDQSGQFEIAFQCPDCPFYGEITVQAPAPEPESDDMAEAPASIEPFARDEDLAGGDGGTYYSSYDTDLTPEERSIFSVPEENDRVDLLNENSNNDTEASSYGDGGSGGISVVTVLSLCLIFLAVGIAVGVGLLWRFSSSARRASPAYSAMEMGKLGFPLKKSSKV